MKKLMTIFGVILFATLILTSCGGNSSKEVTTSKEDNPVDICKCLTEPGNSEWSKNNSDACRDAISKEIGVDNWEKVNMSQNPDISRKFDALAERCTGSNNSGIEVIDQNNNLILNIGTSSGYIWESINTDAKIYTTLAFDGLIFRTSAYSMNGKTNSEDFSKIIDLSGTWNAIDDKNAKGIISTNNVAVNWVFSEDFSFLTNNKGVVFKRIKVK
jgi:hypothetical protein